MYYKDNFDVLVAIVTLALCLGKRRCLEAFARNIDFCAELAEMYNIRLVIFFSLFVLFYVF